MPEAESSPSRADLSRSFNFSFIVPSSTAPYQRCIYGRTRHSSASDSHVAELPLTHDSLSTSASSASLSQGNGYFSWHLCFIYPISSHCRIRRCQPLYSWRGPVTDRSLNSALF